MPLMTDLNGKFRRCLDALDEIPIARVSSQASCQDPWQSKQRRIPTFSIFSLQKCSPLARWNPLAVHSAMKQVMFCHIPSQLSYIFNWHNDLSMAFML